MPDVTRSAVSPLPSPSAEDVPPPAPPHLPDGTTYPGVAVPPGLRPGMPRNAMTSNRERFTREPLHVLAGKLPPDLHGHVFVAGPSVSEGSPALASDGLVLRLDFDGAHATFSSSIMETPSYVAREPVNAGKTSRGPLTRYLNEFRETTLSDVSIALGAQEAPNTAPFLVQGENMMLVTTDAGRPWAIHPMTLEAYTPLGYLREWKPAIGTPWTFPLLQSTAHPAFAFEHPVAISEAPGAGQKPRLFLTNHAPKWPLGEGWTHLVSWDTWENRLHHWSLIDAATGKPVVTQSLHQIAVTRDYVVLLDSNFPVNFWSIAVQSALPGMTRLQRLVSRLTSEPSYPQAVFWVVKRSDLRPSPGTLLPDDPPRIPAYRFQSGGGGLHFAARYENPDDVITIVVGHSPTEDLSHTIQEGDLLINGNRAQAYQQGMPTAVPVTRSSLGVHHIDMRRRTIESKLHSHDDYTWGLTVFSNTGLINGELETNLKLYLDEVPREPPPGGEPPGGINWGIPEDELAIYFNSDGFTADMVPEFIYQMYKPIVGDREGMPIREGRAASFFKFFVNSGRFEGYVLPTGWFGFAPQFVPSIKLPMVPYWKGYVVALVVSDPTPNLPPDSTGDEVWIFDSEDIAKGPICRLGSKNFDIGMTLHTTYLPPGLGDILDGHVPDDPPYCVDVREDYDVSAMQKAYEDWLPGLFPRVPRALFAPWRMGVRWVLNFPKLREVFENDVYPRFTMRPPRKK